MTEKTHASHTLGLELAPTRLKIAELSFKRGHVHIDRLDEFYFGPSADTPQLNDDDRSTLDLSGKTLVVTSVEASETLVRSLEVKLKKEKDIDAVLMFQAEPLLPYPVESALIDKIILSSDSGGTLLTLLAIKKEHLQRHLELWKALGIESEIATGVPVALAAFSGYLLPADVTANFVLHLGEEQTCCIYIKEGKLIASKASPFSLNTIKQAYRQESGIQDEKALTKTFNEQVWNGDGAMAKYPGTFQKIKDFSIEIGKVIFSLMKQTKELKLPPLLATGEGAVNENLAQLLLKEFSGQLLNPDHSITPKYSNAELRVQAIPIGNALIGLPNYKHQINFLQGEFIFSKPWRRLTRPLMVYFLLCLGLTLAFYLFGQAYLSNQESHLRNQYAHLLAMMKKSYAAKEEEVAKMIAPQEEMKLQPIPITPLKDLTPDQITFRASLLEKELQAIPNLFPLEPNIPKVSDLLAWFSTHPNIVGKDSGTPLIKLEGLTYTITKRPELKAKQEKYQVRVELDFTSSNATAAREFHDALLAPNDFIDPKTEIKWTTQKGRYKAVFMLKDKTTYP